MKSLTDNLENQTNCISLIQRVQNGYDDAGQEVCNISNLGKTSETKFLQSSVTLNVVETADAFWQTWC